MMFVTRFATATEVPVRHSSPQVDNLYLLVLDPRRTIRWIYVGRLSIASAIFVAAFLTWFQSDPARTLVATATLVGAILFTGASFAWTELNRKPLTKGFLYGQLIVDTLVVTAVVHVTSIPPAGSQFAALYILVNAAAALLLPITGALLIAALGIVVYAFDAIVVSGFSTATLLQLLVFSIVAVSTAYLASRLQQAGHGRQQLVAELTRVRLREKDILANIKSGIVTVDGSGTLLFANRSANALLGLDLESMIGSPVLPTLRAIAPVLADALDHSLRDNTSSLRVEGEIARSDRTFSFGGTTTSAGGEPDGGGPSTTAIFQDISDNIRLQQLNLRAQRLEAVAELSASMAHEIKNPLASIRSAVEQMSTRPAATHDERTLGNLIVRESDRLSRLLSEFLDFARVRVTRRDPVDVGAVARTAGALVRAHPDRADTVTLDVDIPATPLMVLGDDDLLHRAVFNLALNAVQASGPNDRVRVVAGVATREQHPHGVSFPHGAEAIQVIDHGPGIPSQVQERLFEPSAPRQRRAAERSSAIRSRHRAIRGAQRRDAGGHQRARNAVHGAAAAHRISPWSIHVTDRDSRPTPIGEKPSVLIVDDESGILETLEILLRNEGFSPHVALGGKAGLEQIPLLSPDIVLTDVRMPQVGGVDILSAARAHDKDTSRHLRDGGRATLQSAMQAVNEGAFYYIQKPFRNDELVAILRRAAEHRMLRVENTTLKKEIRRRDRSAAGAPIGTNRKWLEVLRLAEAVAPTESTVLLMGESGTGKEVVARYIHDLSHRTDGPFLSINCGALPEGLLESELFGHVKGSFTGAVRDKSGLFTAAAGGTFFLDEIGETTPATQVKLLRVLQHREVIPVGATDAQPIDTRILAATNRDLEEEIKRGNFRRDLFYRLNVIALHLPPLRQRADDIPLLAETFLARHAEQRGERPKQVSDAAMEILQSYSWPGNVRELENAVERAVILTDGDVIDVDGLPEKIGERRAEPLRLDRTPANPTMETIERAYIMWVLESEQGNKTRAAEILGIDPSTLHRKLSRFGVET